MRSRRVGVKLGTVRNAHFEPGSTQPSSRVNSTRNVTCELLKYIAAHSY